MKIDEERKAKLIRILELKQCLRNTDYQAIKYSEGELSTADYSSIREKRRLWRAEINMLEKELKELKELC